MKNSRSQLLQRPVLAFVPLPAVWDTSATVQDAGMQKLPLGKVRQEGLGEVSSSGGYRPVTPGTFTSAPTTGSGSSSFTAGSVNRVIIATWADYKKAGPLLFSLDHRGTADGKRSAFFSNCGRQTGGRAPGWTRSNLLAGCGGRDCSRCIWRRRRDARFARIGLTNECNLSCAFCYRDPSASIASTSSRFERCSTGCRSVSESWPGEWPAPAVSRDARALRSRNVKRR